MHNELENEELKQEAIILRCATDLQLFTEAFFPHYIQNEFNEYHEDTFETIKYRERNVRRVRAAPRGSAKSVLNAFIKPIHDVCYGLEKFIVIISSTSPLAVKKLKDIRNEVFTNDALRLFYGLSFRAKKVNASEFVAYSDSGLTYFQALGRGTELRGIRVGETRPTKIVLDDVEFSDEVYNERIREKTKDWFFEDVTKAGAVGTNIEFIGTILHKDSLLVKILKNPVYDGKIYKSVKSWSDNEKLWDEWKKIFTNIDNPNRLTDSEAFYEQNKVDMLEGTEVMWPDREPYLHLMKEMVEIGKRAFYKEKQNDPQGDEDNVFENFHWYEQTDDGIYVINSKKLIPWSELTPIGVIDPSTGKSTTTKMSDFTVLLTGYYQKVAGERWNRVFVHDDWTKRVSPTRQIQEIYEKHKHYKFEQFGVETNLFRDLFTENLREYEKVKKIGNKLKVAEIYQTINKIERITKIEPKVNNGWIVLNKNLSHEFRGQVEDFPKADHDDGPDAMEMLWSMVNPETSSSSVGVNAMQGR